MLNFIRRRALPTAEMEKLEGQQEMHHVNIYEVQDEWQRIIALTLSAPNWVFITVARSLKLPL